MRHAYGFDKPIWVQYWKIMHQIFNGSIQSYSQHVTVFSQIKRGLPATFSLAIGAAIIWLAIGVIFGVVGALRAGKFTDVAITTVSFVGISAPTFVVGAILLYFLTFKATIFPAGGYVPLTNDPVQWFQHLVLPWFTLAILYIGVYAQVLRSSVLDALVHRCGAHGVREGAVQATRAHQARPAGLADPHRLAVGVGLRRRHRWFHAGR